MKDDVATVKRALALEDGPTVLVGHSYGGVVITEAGNDPKCPHSYTSPLLHPMLASPSGSLGASAEAAPMGAEARPDAHGFLKITEAGVKNDFAQDLSPTEKDVLFAAQARRRQAPSGKRVGRGLEDETELVPGRESGPRHSAELERAMAKNIKAKTIEVAARHVAMLSRPQETANLILEAPRKE